MPRPRVVFCVGALIDQDLCLSKSDVNISSGGKGGSGAGGGAFLRTIFPQGRKHVFAGADRHECLVLSRESHMYCACVCQIGVLIANMQY